jgi:MFS family permease
VRRYLDLLRLPDVARLMAATTMARLPYGINILALILLLRAEGVSYAGVGLVTGTMSLATAATVPVLGRLVDRLGQTRVLLATACIAMVTNVALALSVLGGAPVWALTALAALAGGSYPPVSPSMRALWRRLLPPDRIDTAFALDALLLELVFIAGPLLAAGIAAWTSPQAAFLTGVALLVGGALLFASAPASRRWRPEPSGERRRAGALSAAGMRALVPTLAIGGIALGALEIAIPAFAEEHGSRGDSGWLFALWASGSLAGGLWYGSRRWRLSAYRRFLLVSTVLVCGLAPLPLASSILAFAALLVVAGLGLAPSSAVGYSLVVQLAPPGALTEAYAWQIVGYVAGNAAGAWIAGAAIDSIGVAAALTVAPLAAAAALALALATRGALAPVATPRP